MRSTGWFSCTLRRSGWYSWCRRLIRCRQTSDFTNVVGTLVPWVGPWCEHSLGRLLYVWSHCRRQFWTSTSPLPQSSNLQQYPCIIDPLRNYRWWSGPYWGTCIQRENCQCLSGRSQCQIELSVGGHWPIWRCLRKRGTLACHVDAWHRSDKCILMPWWVSLRVIVPACDNTVPIQRLCKKRKGVEAWQLLGNYSLEQCQEVGVENDGVWKYRRACGLTEDCSVFGSGSNGGLKGNDWVVCATCARMMGCAGLEWVPIRVIRGKNAQKMTQQWSWLGPGMLWRWRKRP